MWAVDRRRPQRVHIQLKRFSSLAYKHMRACTRLTNTVVPTISQERLMTLMTER